MRAEDAAEPVTPAERPDAITAAIAFIEQEFPTCSVALLAGSVARGEGHARSDLDMVIVSTDATPHWATHEAFGWPIEAFVHTPTSYLENFHYDIRQRWPLRPILCAEGLVLRDSDGLAEAMKATARKLLAEGPAPLNTEEIADYRFTLTWMLDDLADADTSDEARLVGHDLANVAARCLLASQRQWLGKGKWLLRRLREADPARARAWTQALAALDQQNETAPLLHFARGVLDALGGRQFAGQATIWS